MRKGMNRGADNFWVFLNVSCGCAKKKFKQGYDGPTPASGACSPRYHEPLHSQQARSRSPYLASQWIRMYILYNIDRVGAIIIHGLLVRL